MYVWNQNKFDDIVVNCYDFVEDTYTHFIVKIIMM